MKILKYNIGEWKSTATTSTISNLPYFDICSSKMNRHFINSKTLPKSRLHGDFVDALKNVDMIEITVAQCDSAKVTVNTNEHVN